MRFLVVVATLGAWLVVAVAPASPAASRCGSTVSGGGHTWIVASNLSCAQALPVARVLAGAHVIGHVTRNGISITLLSGPRGWTCATSSARGRACSRGRTDTVTMVLIS